MNEIVQLITQISQQDNIFTILFIGLFLWQMKSHKTELDYYKELVNKVLRVIQEDVNEIKDTIENKGGSQHE